MPLNEHVFSVLIVSSSEKFFGSLKTLLPKKDYDPVYTAKSISEAKRKFLEHPCDLVLINAPLPDDFGSRFAVDVTVDKTSVALLFVRNEQYAEVYASVSRHGVLTIRKPTTLQILSQSLDWMRSTNDRLRRLSRKAVSLEDKMAEIRLVNRAKWKLIEACRMTEAEAHRHIEKQAMDQSVTRREIAERILKTYG